MDAAERKEILGRYLTHSRHFEEVAARRRGNVVGDVIHLQAPPRALEQDRLQRTLDVKKAVYTTIIQQYEQARLEEARNVPTLTVLADPYVPIKKSGPPRRLIIALFAMAGLGMLWLHKKMNAFLMRLRAEDPEAWRSLEKMRGLLRRQTRRS